MTRDEYEKWSEKVEEAGGRHIFDTPDVDPELLTDGEEYLDMRVICRRGQHDWRLGRGGGLDHHGHAEEQNYDERGIEALYCQRCNAWGEAKIEIVKEGDTRQNRPHREHLKHVSEMDEDDILEELVYYDGPKLFTFEDATGKLQMAMALQGEKYVGERFMILDDLNQGQLDKFKAGRITLWHIVDWQEAVLIDEGDDWTLVMRDDIPEEDMPREDSYFYEGKKSDDR